MKDSRGDNKKKGGRARREEGEESESERREDNALKSASVSAKQRVMPRGDRRTKPCRTPFQNKIMAGEKTDLAPITRQLGLGRLIWLWLHPLGRLRRFRGNSAVVMLE